MKIKSLAVAAAIGLSSFVAFASAPPPPVISFSDQGVASFKSLAFTGTGPFSQSFTFDNLAAGVYDISGDISGTYVSFDNITLDREKWTTITSGKFSFGYVEYTGSAPLSLTVSGSNTNSSGNFSGSVSAIPEPETFAMLLAGLGLIGTIGRRRSIAAANA